MAWRNKIREAMATASEGDTVEVKLTPAEYDEIAVERLYKVDNFMKKNYGFAPVQYKVNTDYICKYRLEFTIAPN